MSDPNQNAPSQPPLGLSFDDVLLVPQYSEVLPAEANLTSRLTDTIELNIPVISSAMDTVTEAQLAIALAREGGIGVIHRNCPIEEQRTMVDKVKRAENLIVEKPFSVQPSATIDELRQLVDSTGVSSFPVVDENNILKGIITRRDMRMAEEHGKTVADYMTGREKLITGHTGMSLPEAKKILYEHRIEKLPLVDTDGKLSGLITTADIEKRMMYSMGVKDDDGHLLCGAAIGMGPDFFERATALIDANVDALFIDAATGHTKRTLDVIEKVRSEFPDTPVIAGNVVTEKGADDLIDAGAAAIKVGVGPGSICTTRVIAGVGVPQFTAIQNAARSCNRRGVPLIADGGMRYSGDIIKALAAGADFVMLGGLLAGTEEAPGATVRHQGRTFKTYRGMGSLKAMRKGAGDRYGQNSSGKLVAEGVEARVPYKGLLAQVVFQLMGGVRSGMGYVGAPDLAELRERAVFTRITSGGLKESHPHDIHITEEPTNYSVS